MWAIAVIFICAVAANAVEKKGPNKCPQYSSPANPPDCGQNAYFTMCTPQCPPHQNCSIIWSRIACYPDENYCCYPSCRCNDGYYRDENNKCITTNQCMGLPDEDPTTTSAPCTDTPKPRPKQAAKKCKGPNEKWVNCRTKCPPQKCDISYTTYTCKPEDKVCEPGCDCIENYLRVNNGACVKNDDCPPQYSTSAR